MRVSLRVAEGSKAWGEVANVIIVCVEWLSKDSNLEVEGVVVVADDPSVMHEGLVLRCDGCLVVYYLFDDADWCGEWDTDLKHVHG